MKRKVFYAVGMACLFGISVLTGCTTSKSGGNTDATTNEQSSSNQETNAEASIESEDSAVAGIEGWDPFAETVTIQIPVFDRSKEGYPDVTNNYWTKWVQKEFGDKYNVKVEYVAIPRSDVLTKYNMLIASNETPTVLMEFDIPKLAMWATDGALQEFTMEDFAQVAPNYYQKMVDNDLVKYSTIKEKTFFALAERPYSNIDYTNVTFVRKDWLDKVGLDVPDSYEEYSAAIEAIKAAGLTDHSPLGMRCPYMAYVPNFSFREDPVNDEEWAMNSSVSTASLPWNPTKSYLKRLNEEYNKGWYSSEFELDLDGNQEKADFVNGKTFSYTGYISANVDWLTAFYENNPDAELAALNPSYVVEEGIANHPSTLASNPFGMIVGFSSLATQDQLKAAWMYMEWMLQDDVLFTLENGIEGVTYTLDADGIPIVDANYRGEEMLNHNCNFDMTSIVHASKVMDTAEKTLKVDTPQGIPQDLYGEILKNYQWREEMAKNGWSYPDPVYNTAIEAESEYGASLLSIYQECAVKLIKCAPENFETLYDVLSQRYLDSG
ncbi:MAG: extracellular solute-binding protein, partial [Suipraeoptans sp.]